MIAILIILLFVYILGGGMFQAQHGFWAHKRPRGEDFDHDAHDASGCGWLVALCALCGVIVALGAAIAGGGA